MLRTIPLSVAALVLAASTLSAQTPGAPGNLTAVANADFTVTLTWTAPTTGGTPTSYIVQVGTTSGASNVINAQIPVATTYTTGTLTIGTMYFARVRAVNGSGIGTASNEATVTVSCPTPAAATDLAWRPFGASNEVQVVWTNADDLTWTVSVGSAPGLSDVLVTQPPFQKKRGITMTLPGGTNYVRVNGVNSCGNVAPTSAEIAVTAGQALGTSPVLINEFGSFVELKNVSGAAVDVSGWKLYASATFEQRVTLSETLPPGTTLGAGCTYLLMAPASETFFGVTADQGLSTFGRSYAVSNPAGRIQDSAARRPSDDLDPQSVLGEGGLLGDLTGQSFARLGDQDTNDNATDFIMLTTATPQNSAACQSGGPGPTPTPNPPGAPSSLAAHVNGRSVTLMWNAPVTGGAPTTYILEAGTAPGASNAGVFAISTASTSVTFGSVANGVFYVRMKAMNADGTSAASNEVMLTVCADGCVLPPEAPSGLAYQVSGTSVLLSWTAPANGAAPTDYVLEAGTAPGLANLVNTGTGSRASFVIVNNVPPGAYYVRVRSRNGAGTSSVSNEVLVIVP
ncbi:MAG: fibronectin type III domain-containing protein [Vicinamibacterales bacterium]